MVPGALSLFLTANLAFLLFLLAHWVVTAVTAVIPPFLPIHSRLMAVIPSFLLVSLGLLAVPVSFLLVLCGFRAFPSGPIQGRGLKSHS